VYLFCLSICFSVPGGTVDICIINYLALEYDGNGIVLRVCGTFVGWMIIPVILLFIVHNGH